MNALISGSFDPITLGHVNIIERVSRMFDKVYVAGMNNDSAKYDKSLKSKVNSFTNEQRLEMVRFSTSHIANVIPVYYAGMLIDACDEFDISAVVRGVRNAEDFEYEMIHARWNREHNKRAETLFMPADPKFDGISSSLVKRIIFEDKNPNALDGLVSKKVINYIKNFLY